MELSNEDMALFETEVLSGKVEAHGDVVETVSVGIENSKIELID